MRTIGRLGALAAAVVLLLTALPRAASAHAVLVSSGPAAGARLDAAPVRVSLSFDEPVETGPDALRVFGPDGNRVDASGPAHPAGGGQSVVVALHTGLPHGTYTVAWRVV